MKRFFAISLAVLFCATAANVSAKGMSSAMSAKSQVMMWLGTWNCVSGKQHYKVTFTPILGGTAMRVVDTSANPSEGIARFDTTQKQWFYTAVMQNGAYFSMMGTMSGNDLAFKQVAPQGDGTLVVHRPSAKKYTDVFSMTVGGKKMVIPETCTL